MKQALISKKDKIITIDEFIKYYKHDYDLNKITVECINCGGDLHTYGINSPNETACFHHKNKNDCPLSDPKLAKNIPQEYNDENYKQILSDMKNQTNTKKIYALCCKEIGRSLSFKEFYELVKLGKKKKYFSLCKS
ncbi:hypothetical protein [Campylobacter fetus]|uniref:hypothetical protein n=1 Tax=Campylobacter fetus TaxID=196 RepID=UPI000818B521|nr:hypothetical protein [Campylobacter fetus]OCS05835.1 hypothetical protein AC237_01555 [Campylobacter fetus subsp. testudinum]